MFLLTLWLLSLVLVAINASDIDSDYDPDFEDEEHDETQLKQQRQFDIQFVPQQAQHQHQHRAYQVGFEQQLQLFFERQQPRGNSAVASKKPLITVATQFLHNMQMLEHCKQISDSAAGDDLTSRNTVFSPFIIDLPLSYLFVVAKEQTLQEFVTLMENSNDKSVSVMIDQYSSVLNQYKQIQNPIVQVASKIWIHPNVIVNDSYLNQIDQSKTDIIAKLKPQGSKNMINAWISEQTSGKITQIVDEEIDLNDDEWKGFLLTSAIYFDAKFTDSHKFERSATKTDYFFVSNDFDSFENQYNDHPNKYDFRKRVTTQVKMMSKTAEYRHAYYESGARKYEIVELKCQRYQISASILIVKPLNNHAWQNPLDVNDIFGNGNVMESLQYKEVHLQLPKFKFETRIDLKSALMNLGIIEAFSQSTANFDGFGTIKSETSDEQEPFPFYILKATHTAGIDVFEEGAVAYAACFFRPAVLSASPVRPVSFKVNRPFHAFIIDNTNKLVLFHAKVRQPTIAET